jgi:exodeoxyribonuclease VII small subunit
MSDERTTFEMTKSRLEDIVGQVKRKDVSLEQSLDLLEEAVRLVNQCNELIDQTSWQAPAPASEDDATGEQEAGAGESVAGVIAANTDGDGAVDLVEIAVEVDLDGDGVADAVEVVDLVDTDGDGVVDTIVDTLAPLGAEADEDRGADTVLGEATTDDDLDEPSGVLEDDERA